MRVIFDIGLLKMVISFDIKLLNKFVVGLLEIMCRHLELKDGFWFLEICW